MKRILQSLLLLLVLLGIGAGIYQKLQPAPSVSPEPTVTAAADAVASAPVRSERVTVTYFTSDVRCISCKKIEALTRETLNERFADALADGALVFETHNIDRPENKHYVEDYELSFKTVIIAKESADPKQVRWQRMDDVWTYLNEPESFKDYLDAGIREVLPKTI
ncbi:nitrophenyl compound nitroreductase subunit ArsF family protein [Coraliomargarita algicola]|uniref:Nitrophenyl compound nitroreductase subunit ArsF family protein n=1 Tax=Coraliomargarita algicola TaxID=3092156 RepID=A0ABZ0RKP3_9BACT|nr:nitrophenyl compound nitroreductase subunit ArsF family protein [Coraliomargarita sp. J2-16]WPJ95653.1 nitrophenyl compound nitroreductase subunit ArsF family protein [Coraliomargarita sp. J2-16]